MVLINDEDIEKIQVIVKDEKEKEHIKFCGSKIRLLVMRKVEQEIKNWTKRINKSGDRVIESPANIARAIGDYIDYLLMQDENFLYHYGRREK